VSPFFISPISKTSTKLGPYLLMYLCSTKANRRSGKVELLQLCKYQIFNPSLLRLYFLLKYSISDLSLVFHTAQSFQTKKSRKGFNLLLIPRPISTYILSLESLIHRCRTPVGTKSSFLLQLSRMKY
jgi:hypothetical protein